MRMCYSLAIVAMVVATAMARPEHHVGHRNVVDKYYNSVPSVFPDLDDDDDDDLPYDVLTLPVGKRSLEAYYSRQSVNAASDRDHTPSAIRRSGGGGGDAADGEQIRALKMIDSSLAHMSRPRFGKRSGKRASPGFEESYLPVLLCFVPAQR